MSYYSRIPQTTFGNAWQDGSISLLRNDYADSALKPEPDGRILVAVYEYSSDIIPVFSCVNEASVQYFVHRFSRAIDSWHDVFTPGPVLHFTLQHRPAGGDGDIAAQLTSEVDIAFAGWVVSGDPATTIFTTLDAASDFLNNPTNWGYTMANESENLEA